MIRSPHHLLIALVAVAPLAFTGVAACGGKSDESAATAPKSAEERRAAITANQIFSERCVTCHGERGQGDGPGSAALDPKPRNFTDHAWQQSVTDEHIEKIIKFGGSAVGKSAAMPANPDLQSKDSVVVALRQLVRRLGR
ncbi:MAG: c-type cytochrome [Deltaproteobacteria bacterium]|nr:c-type cytochrome [Deltaproteobacteria bacterium]